MDNISKYIVMMAAVAFSADAHNSHHHAQRGPSKVVRQENPPYPTGPGYDVVPLESIVPLPPTYTQNTVTVPTIFPPGSQPPFPNAPPIPQFNVADVPWPPDWTVPPATDSPQVQEWLKELDGHDIPNIPLKKPVPKADGNGVTCEDNPDAVKTAGADKDCWWTCGGCIRDEDISTCKDKGTWGQTYDDGPGLYTPKLLAFLESKGLSATFFLEGGPTVSRPETVIYQHMMGYELAVHTWSHPGLTSLTNEQIVSELGWSRYAIQKVAGVTPTMMRPPYGDIDDRVRAISHAMGLTPVLWTTSSDGNGGVIEIDSQDWRVHGGQVQAVPNQRSFEAILDQAKNRNDGIIALQHDVYPETVDIAIGATIPFALSSNPPWNYKSVQVCLGNTIADAYHETATNPTNPLAPSRSSNGNSTTTGSNTQSSSTRTGTQTGAPSQTPGNGAGRLGLEALVVALVAVFISGLVF